MKGFNLLGSLVLLLIYVNDVHSKSVSLLEIANDAAEVPERGKIEVNEMRDAEEPEQLPFIRFKKELKSNLSESQPDEPAKEAGEAPADEVPKEEQESVFFEDQGYHHVGKKQPKTSSQTYFENEIMEQEGNSDEEIAEGQEDNKSGENGMAEGFWEEEAEGGAPKDEAESTFFEDRVEAPLEEGAPDVEEESAFDEFQGYHIQSNDVPKKQPEFNHTDAEEKEDGQNKEDYFEKLLVKGIEEAENSMGKINAEENAVNATEVDDDNKRINGTTVNYWEDGKIQDNEIGYDGKSNTSGVKHGNASAGILPDKVKEPEQLPLLIEEYENDLMKYLSEREPEEGGVPAGEAESAFDEFQGYHNQSNDVPKKQPEFNHTDAEEKEDGQDKEDYFEKLMVKGNETIEEAENSTGKINAEENAVNATEVDDDNKTINGTTANYWEYGNVQDGEHDYGEKNTTKVEGQGYHNVSWMQPQANKTNEKNITIEEELSNIDDEQNVVKSDGNEENENVTEVFGQDGNLKNVTVEDGVENENETFTEDYSILIVSQVDQNNNSDAFVVTGNHVVEPSGFFPKMIKFFDRVGARIASFSFSIWNAFQKESPARE